MAATRRTSDGAAATVVAVAAIVLALGLLFFADPTEACGSRCPGTTYTKPLTPISPAPPSAGGGGGKCPVSVLKLGVCADVLGGGLTNLLGRGSRSASSRKPCCELVGGLADLDAAVCLCTAVHANVLGIVDLDLPVQLSLLVNHCGRKLPAGFQCPN